MKVYINYDTSGSVTNEQLQKMLEAGKDFIRKLEPGVLVSEQYFDMEIRPMDSERPSCRGTDLNAPREDFLKKAKPGDKLVIFTDGYCPSMKPLPEDYLYEQIIINE